MAKLGGLSVVITADTAGLKKGLKGAQIALRDGAKEVRKKANEWGKWAAAAATAATAATAAIVKSNLTQVQELKNLADAANTTVDVLQRQAYATKSVGLETKDYADILLDMNDRVGDFVETGAGPMVDFFEQIAPKVGVTADQFRALSGPDALQLYVSSLEKAGVNQQQMTFYMEALSSQSTRLLPLLKNNGEAMQQMEQRAKTLNVGLSELDVLKAVQANQAITDAATALDSELKKATIAVAPYLTVLTEEMLGLGLTTDDYGKTVQTVFRNSGKIIGVFADGIRGIQVAFKGLEVVARAVNAGIAIAVDQTVKAIAIAFNSIMATFSQTLANMAKSVRGLGPAGKAMAKLFDASAKSLQGLEVQGSQTFENIAQSQVEALEIAKQEFNDLAKAELPSVQIDKFFDKVEARVQQLNEDNRIRIGAETNIKTLQNIDNLADAFETRAVSMGEAFRQNITGIPLNTQSLDAFWSIMQKGTETTKVELRAALSGSLSEDKANQFFGLISQRAQQSGTMLNMAMQNGLTTDPVEAFFELLRNNAGSFNQIMAETFGGNLFDPSQINEFFSILDGRAEISSQELREQLSLSGLLSTEQIDTFFNHLGDSASITADQLTQALNVSAMLDSEQANQFFSNLQSSAESTAEVLRSQLADKVKSGLMSEEDVDNFVAMYLAKTAAISEEVRANLSGGLTAGGEQADTGEDETGTKGFGTQELFDALATEQEWIRQQHETELRMLEEARQRKIDLGASYDEIEKQMKQRQAKELADIEAKSGQMQLSTLTSTLGAMSQALSTGGAKSQKIAKKLAIAKAVISGGQAAVDAWKAGMATGGPFAPAVAAAYTAASLARTAGMIRSIKGNSTPSAGGRSLPQASTPTPPSADNQQGQSATRNVNISLVGGSLFTSDNVRELIGLLNDEIGDGVNLGVSG